MYNVEQVFSNGFADIKILEMFLKEMAADVVGLNKNTSDVLKEFNYNEVVNKFIYSTNKLSVFYKSLNITNDNCYDQEIDAINYVCFKNLNDSFIKNTKSLDVTLTIFKSSTSGVPLTTLFTVKIPNFLFELKASQKNIFFIEKTVLLNYVKNIVGTTVFNTADMFYFDAKYKTVNDVNNIDLYYEKNFFEEKVFNSLK